MFNKGNKSARGFKPLKVLFYIGLFALFVFLASWLVMFLWNAILPEVLGVKPLTFWQAAGLLLLSKILFSGVGRGGGRWRNSKKKHWKNKWMNMNADERHAAKSRWKAYCERKNTPSP